MYFDSKTLSGGLTKEQAQYIHLDEEGNEYYEIEAILDKKKVGNETKYLVSWKGWGPEGNTWEPIETLWPVMDLVDAFNERRKAKKKKPLVKESAGKGKRLKKLGDSSSALGSEESNSINNVLEEDQGFMIKKKTNKNILLDEDLEEHNFGSSTDKIVEEVIEKKDVLPKAPEVREEVKAAEKPVEQKKRTSFPEIKLPVQIGYVPTGLDEDAFKVTNSGSSRLQNKDINIETMDKKKIPEPIQVIKNQLNEIRPEKQMIIDPIPEEKNSLPVQGQSSDVQKKSAEKAQEPYDPLKANGALIKGAILPPDSDIKAPEKNLKTPIMLILDDLDNLDDDDLIILSDEDEKHPPKKDLTPPAQSFPPLKKDISREQRRSDEKGFRIKDDKTTFSMTSEPPQKPSDIKNKEISKLSRGEEERKHKIKRKSREDSSKRSRSRSKSKSNERIKRKEAAAQHKKNAEPARSKERDQKRKEVLQSKTVPSENVFSKTTVASLLPENKAINRTTPQKPKYLVKKSRFAKTKMQDPRAALNEKAYYKSITADYLQKTIDRSTFLTLLCPEGNFQDDEVQEIMALTWEGKTSQNPYDYYFKVVWKPRKNGVQMGTSYVSWQEVLKGSPKEAAEFVFKKLVTIISNYGTFGEC